MPQQQWEAIWATMPVVVLTPGHLSLDSSVKRSPGLSPLCALSERCVHSAELTFTVRPIVIARSLTAKCFTLELYSGQSRSSFELLHVRSIV